LHELLRALSRLSLSPETAVAERVAPLLYHASPEASSPRLKKAYYESGARNVNLLEALEDIRSAMARRSVEPIALKGADLATSLYQNVALRPMGDLDLWVGFDEVSRAEEAIAALGYRPGCPEMTEGLSREIKHARVHVGGRRDEIAVDLHWSLVGHHEDRRSPRSLDWFRDRAGNGRLDSTAHLLYLAAHMKLQHYDERVPLLWLCDFYLLSQRRDVDWNELSRAAGEFGWTKALAATAEETRGRLSLVLPDPLERLVNDGPKGRLPATKYGPERAWNELSTLGWSGRAALLRGYLFPSPSYVRWRYEPRPAWAWPLCYPFRWARLIASAITVLVRRRSARPALEGSR
jgi:hypothetical protein